MPTDINLEECEERGPTEIEEESILSLYVGMWRKGTQVREGRGLFIESKRGNMFEGYLHDNKAHGYGRVILSDGRYYEGQFKNDKINGHCVMKWSDGRRYEGEWQDNKTHGRGK